MLDEFEFLKKHASLMLELSMDPAKIDQDSTESEESNSSFVEVTHSTFVLEVCTYLVVTFFFSELLTACHKNEFQNFNKLEPIFFVSSCSWHQKNETKNSPIHEFKVLLKGQIAF